MCHVIYLLVARVHNDFVRKGCFSNENGVSLRLCNVEELVLLGPCFADVNVETVTYLTKVGLLSTDIWTFLWCFRAALHNVWWICCVPLQKASV